MFTAATLTCLKASPVRRRYNLAFVFLAFGGAQKT
jgi:hypothetical protein